jgi:hypothetical protein
MKPIFALALLTVGFGAYRLAAIPPPSPSDEVVAAAQAFLGALPAEQRAKAERPFDLATRQVWQFTPGDRAGARVKDLDVKQRALANDLLRKSLSAQGYAKTQNIVALEDVLGGTYASDLYWVEVFGTPSKDAPWGWQFEGHHVVLTFTYAKGQLSMTPAFFGAHPALVKGGKLDGMRVLGAEEDLALKLYSTLSAEQSVKARVDDTAPADIFTGPGRDTALKGFAGVAGRDLTAEQRKLLLDVVDAYVLNAPASEAANRLAAIKRTLDDTRFAWYGPARKGERFYYRVHGPAVLIEFDHTSASRRDDPHIHAIWRTPGRDYGEDLLKQHYAEHRH